MLETLEGDDEDEEGESLYPEDIDEADIDPNATPEDLAVE